MDFVIIRQDSLWPDLILTPDIFTLLSHRGSLTQRFEEVMGVKPRLTRLKQKREFVSREERALLPIAARELALVREIKMAKGEKDWMFARTVIPNSTLSGSARRLANLKDAPIGKILFSRNGAERVSLTLELTNHFPNSLKHLRASLDYPLWRRRSIFEFDSGPILVTELFLPDCPIYTDAN